MSQARNQAAPVSNLPNVVAPAEEIASVAVFRSGETKRLSRDLGFDVAVVTVVEDPAAVASRLTRTWHGAFHPREGWVLPFDCLAMPSAMRFELFAMDERWLGGRALPPGMSLRGGMLGVSLAPGLSRRVLATAFAAAMEDLYFERIAARPARVDFRFRTRRPMVVGARYAAPAHGWQLPPMVTDIYWFRPRSLHMIVSRAAQARTIVNVRAALASGSRAGVARHP